MLLKIIKNTLKCPCQCVTKMIFISQVANLRKMSIKLYPAAKKKHLKLARNFICSCMRFLPEERANATKLWKHKFVGGVEKYPEDKIWQKKCK